MIFIRSVIFFIVFIVLTLFLSVFMTIATIIRNKKLLCNVTSIWARCVIFFLKIICGINYRVEGIENLPDDNQNYLVVSKHQSTWETYFLYYFFKNRASFVLKKELLSVPVIGYGLKNSGHIAIDRKAGSSAMKKLINDAERIINEEHRKIVIFPQGTRVPIGGTIKDYQYKSGFLGIVKDLKLDMIPVALNTGCFWPKKSFIKKPGTIIIKILPMIKYSDIKDKNKDEIISNIANTIESESDKLVVK